MSNTNIIHPKYGHTVVHNEQEHKAAEALDKLTGIAPAPSILSNVVHAAAQAGGAAFHVAVNTASTIVEKTQAVTSDVAHAAKDIAVGAAEAARDVTHDAATLATNVVTATKDQALNAMHSAAHTAADTYDAAKHVAQDKVSDLSAAAQIKAADLSSAVSDLSIAAKEKAAGVVEAAQATVASAAPVTTTTTPAPHQALPFEAELLEKRHEAPPAVLPFKDELLHLGALPREPEAAHGSLPFADELLEKRHAAPPAAPLPFKADINQLNSGEAASATVQQPAADLSAQPASSEKKDELFAQEKVERDEKTEVADGELKLSMDVVAHLQRIADRTGDAVLHETARKAHSAFAKGLNDAPGVHLTRVNSSQANELLNLAIQTQDRELADFARYCQSVADTTGIAVEPTPGKILQEIEKGKQELQTQGRVHTGPGYGAAFASVDNKTKRLSTGPASTLQADKTDGAQLFNGKLELTMDVVAHVQRIADRTGDALLHETARRAHSACAKGLSEAPGVHLTWVTPQQANELLNLAIQTQDRELADFARYCQSVAATTQIAVEPTPGKIAQEIEKGRSELQSQGRVHTGPGYGAAFASVGSNTQGQRENRRSGNFSENRKSGDFSGNRKSGDFSSNRKSGDFSGNRKSGDFSGNRRSGNFSGENKALFGGDLALSMSVVGHIQRIADRTGDALLKETANRAHSAFSKGLNEAPGVHLTWVTPEQANELLNLAIQTQDRELADFARYCQSVAATTQIAVEPTPGKIAQEIERGRQDLQSQGRVHSGPGYGAAFASTSATPSTGQPQQ